MIKIFNKQLLKKYKDIFKVFLEIIGALLSIYEFINLFFPDILNGIKLNYVAFIIIILIIINISIIFNFPKLKRTFNIKNRDIRITIVVGDIFKQKGSMIIPTNTTFDTCMEGEFISSKSIQGQFQNKFFKNNLTSLDNMISSSLKETKIKEEINDGRKTKIKRYNCGTVAKIIHNKKKYYFLAIADVNKVGSPNAKYDNIIESLQGLWSFLGENKHIESLVIPIIGTGRAGIADATRMKVIKEIILSFVATTTEIKFTNHLVICIHPNDLKNNMIDIDEVFEYVYYTSKYRYEQLDKNDNGIPII